MMISILPDGMWPLWRADCYVSSLSDTKGSVGCTELKQGKYCEADRSNGEGERTVRRSPRVIIPPK